MSLELQKRHKVEMRNITKRFPGVVANDHINFEVETGEVQGLLGENGAGKTTLMNILYGLYQPDEGEIYVRGEKVKITSCRDAISLGIGMVHQLFMLIPAFTVTESVILGAEDAKRGFVNIRQAKEKIKELSERYGLEINPRSKIWQLSVGERQRVEILKQLYRSADIFIFDEPTSALTPKEATSLFSFSRSLAREGHSVIFITHKLREAMEVCDRITVLRRGKLIATVKSESTNERELANMMVGRDLVPPIRPEVEVKEVVLEVKGLHALDEDGNLVLNNVSFNIRRGEIFGIAGVAGNGQSELAEAITGLRKSSGGEVIINEKNMTNAPPQRIRQQKVGYVPEERLTRGTILDFTVAENIILGYQADFALRGMLDSKLIDQYAEKVVEEYGVKTPSVDSTARFLSGGNLQRLILARELSREVQLLISEMPTRGLDIGATDYVHRKLLEAKKRGVAILLISEDLDEILALSDRIGVMYKGQIVGIVPTGKANIEEIGLMMAGAKVDARGKQNETS